MFMLFKYLTVFISGSRSNVGSFSKYNQYSSIQSFLYSLSDLVIYTEYRQNVWVGSLQVVSPSFCTWAEHLTIIVVQQPTCNFLCLACTVPFSTEHLLIALMKCQAGCMFYCFQDEISWLNTILPSLVVQPCGLEWPAGVRWLAW